MARKRTSLSKRQIEKPKKKTCQGNGKYTKRGSKGGGPGGSTPSKKYKKRYRGQGS